MTRWQDMSPAQVLEDFPALTLTQVAYVLRLVHRRGERVGQPDRRLALNLVLNGRLPVIDRNLPTAYWSVSSANLRVYLEGGTTKGAA